MLLNFLFKGSVYTVLFGFVMILSINLGRLLPDVQTEVEVPLIEGLTAGEAVLVLQEVNLLPAYREMDPFTSDQIVVVQWRPAGKKLPPGSGVGFYLKEVNIKKANL